MIDRTSRSIDRLIGKFTNSKRNRSTNLVTRVNLVDDVTEKQIGLVLTLTKKKIVYKLHPKVKVIIEVPTQQL